MSQEVTESLKQDLQTALELLVIAKSGSPHISNTKAQRINRFLAIMRSKGYMPLTPPH